MRGYKTKEEMMRNASAKSNSTHKSTEKKSKKVPKTWGFIIFLLILGVCIIISYNHILFLENNSNYEYADSDFVANDSDFVANDSVLTDSVADDSVADETVITNDENEERELLTGVHNGHEWVDLGLSVKWATCNIGASIPSDYGKYFAWGEIIQKSSYTEENYANKGRLFHDVSGNKQFDVASYIWGDLWRMPTKEEVEELIGCCSIEYAKVDTHNGIKLRSPNGNSIFIPCSGVRTESSYRGIGAYAVFWTSTQYDELSGYAFWRGKCTFTLGYEGLPIRPVMKIKDDI